MEYIPISRIQRKFEEINSLSLPNEIIRYIKKYCDEFLPIPIEYVGDNIDKFWINLGIETCNLKRWNINCVNILQGSFGLNKFNVFSGGLFGSLRSLLDDLVCMNYPLSKSSIQMDGRDIKLIKIFYNIEDIIEYPIEYTKCGRKRKKTITSQDNEYIFKFIERMHIYLNYLEKNVDKLPLNIGKSKVTSINKRLKIIIGKLKQKYDKMYQIVNDMTVI
jgi:hypothetical protein